MSWRNAIRKRKWGLLMKRVVHGLMLLAVVIQPVGVPSLLGAYALAPNTALAQTVDENATPAEETSASTEEATSSDESQVAETDNATTSETTPEDEAAAPEATSATDADTSSESVVADDASDDTPEDNSATETSESDDVTTPDDTTASEATTTAEVAGATTEDIDSTTTEEATDEPETKPELSTDKEDYHPGETATIFGRFFGTLKTYTVKVFGSDENDKNYTETEAQVTANADGSFSYQYVLDALYRPFYKVAVSTLEGVKVAESWFRDSSVGTYDQCSNDDGDGYASGDDGCRWTNGNIQANNSTYFEGDSTVQRLWMEGYAPGSTHTVTFKYGTTKAGKHAYDYLTTWDASENWIVLADRCQDITGCTTATETQFAMQNDPVVTDTIEPSAANRKFTIRGATITNVSIPTIVSGTYAGDSETSVVVSFTVANSGTMCSTKQNVTSCGMALWFGAHVAKGAEWTAFDGTTGAGSISGSPYHVALDQEDGTSVGQRDNQMQSAAILPSASITIIKDAVPNDAQDFSFTTTGTGLSNFSLDDDGNNTLSNTQVFNGLSAGTYTVTEGVVSGWSLTNLVCNDPTTNTTVNIGNRVANIDLAAGEAVVCTFTNTLQQAHLTLLKTVVNDNGGTAVDTDWTLAANGPTPISGVEGNAAVTNAAVNAGSYTLSETGGPTGYTAGTYSCVNNGGQAVVSNSITLAPGDNATCTITNNDNAPALHLRKVVVNDNGGTKTVADFTLTANGTGSNDLSGTSPVDSGAGLLADTFALSETNVTGYTASAWVCVGGTQNGSNITLGLGQSATCTITNNDIAPTLTLVKTVINDNGGTAVANDFQAKIDGNNVAWSVAVPVNAGTRTASETTLPTYTATSWGQDCAANGSITLAPGDNKTCTIANDDIAPSLTLNKIVINDNGGTATESAWTLTANGGAAGNLSGPGAAGNTDVVSGATFKQGTYNLSESGPAGYAATSWSCQKSGSNQLVLGSSVTVGLAEAWTCTITNDDIAPKLHLRKVVTNNNGGAATVADFTLTADGTGSNDLSGTSPVDSGAGLLADTWALSETGVTGYTGSSWICVGGTQNGANITVGVGGEATCTVTNDDNQAYIIVNKVVVNNNGGSAQPNDFALKLDGNATTSGTLIPVTPGIHAASETLLSGYDFTGFSGDCDQNGQVAVALGETKTCTLTNDDKQAYIIVNKTVINDNGGTAAANDFLLTVDGNAVLDEVAYPVNPGTHTAGETLLPGYTAGAWGGDCNTNANVTVALGQTKTCTITNNDIAPKLHLRKVVVNDNGGTKTVADFTLTADGTNTNDLSGVSPVDSGAGLVADTWALSETTQTGYAASDWACVGGQQSGSSITVGIGGEATCTITNDDIQPKLTLTKIVINDNGGAKQVSDFPLFVDANGVTSGVQNGVNAGAHTASETGSADYTASSWSGDCAANGSITLLPGDVKACTITNDDKAAHLIVIKHVINDNGGAAVAGDFTTTISGVNTAVPTAAGAEAPGINNTLTSVGAYSVDEGAHVGYAKDLSADCTGTIALGETKTCTITNNDQQAYIKVVKVVTNDNGGTAEPDDFKLTLEGNATTSGDLVPVDPGTYTAGETLVAGYSFEGFSGDCDSNGDTTVALGESKTCTLTNNDIAPKLHLRKVVVSDNGGTKSITDFTLIADGAGSNDLSGTSPVDSGAGLQADTWALSENSVTGYAGSAWVCVGGNQNGSNITVGIGGEATCTITNDDIAPKLHLRKVVVNDNGGTKTVADFTLTADGANTNDLSGTSPVDSGAGLLADTWALSETSVAGYTASAWSCVGGTQNGANITVGVGGEATCTITNDDIQPTLTLIKHVVNDNGGTKVVSDFPLFVSGNSVVSGATNGFDAGSYTASETTQTGYAPSAWSGDCAANGTVTLSVGENKTCEITNDDIAPKLTLVKTVTNNNGGTKVVADFPLFINGDSVTSGVKNTLSANVLYTATETSDPGYTASSWGQDCATDGTITLQPGDDKTCTINNNDKPAKLTIVKDAQPNDLSDFTFNGTNGLGSFILDDDQGVPDIGQNGDVDRAQSKEYSNISAGAYIVTETQPNSFWKLKSVACTENGQPYNNVTTSATGMTVNLGLGSDVTCTFVNEKQNPTRTIGFWQTHTAYTTSVFNNPANTFSWFTAGNVKVGDGITHQDPINTVGKLFGAFYSSIPKTTTGAQRTAVDKARMQLAQQLVGAKLNCAAFGCSASIQTLIANADTAYATGTAAQILSYASQLDAYNNSGDTIVIGNAGKATPKDSQSIADLVFWNLP